MGFKYINPGYPELFDSFGSGSLYGGSDTARNPENGKYIGFKTAASQVNIPSLKTLYIRFDVYFWDYRDRQKVFKIVGENSTIFDVHTWGSDQGFDLFYKDGETSTDGFFSVINNNTRYNFLLAITIDENKKATVKISLNGEEKYSGSKVTENSKITAVIFSDSSNSHAEAYFSNIIISSEDCSNEHIAIVPLVTIDDEETAVADTKALNAQMSQYFEYKRKITSLQVGATSVALDTGYNAVAEIVDGGTVETKAPTTNQSVMFTNMANDPISQGEWTLENLKKENSP